MAPKLILYVDIVSPFAYVAYNVVKNSEAFKPCQVEFVPVFLGGIMKATGNRPPLVIKNKDKWIEGSRKRWAKMFDIPIASSAPQGFPNNTINVQRALMAISKNQPDKLEDAISAVWHAFWVERNEGKVVGEGLGTVLATVLGEDGAKKALEASKTDQVKQLLNQSTQQAIDDGAFGLPWFVAINDKGEKDAFWGVDHMGLVLRHLGLDRSKLGDKAQALL